MEQLADIVKEGLDAGLSRELIAMGLEKEGYAAEDIEKAFAAMPKVDARTRRTWVIGSAAAVLSLALVFSIGYFFYATKVRQAKIDKENSVFIPPTDSENGVLVAHFIEAGNTELVKRIAYTGEWKSNKPLSSLGTIYELKTPYDLEGAVALGTGSAVFEASNDPTMPRTVSFSFRDGISVTVGTNYAFVFTLPSQDSFASDGRLRMGTYGLKADTPGGQLWYVKGGDSHNISVAKADWRLEPSRSLLYELKAQ